MNAPIWLGVVDFYSGDGSDLVPYVYGAKLFLYQTFQDLGEIPLWNPYFLFGQPIVGNIQYGLFYPLNILFLFLPFFKALWLYHVTHMIIAGIGTYLLARHTGGEKYGSMLAGCLYMINGRMLYYINAGWVDHFGSICWLPLLILMSLQVLKNKALYFPVLLGIVLAMTFLAGTPQYTLLGCCLFFVQAIRQFFIYQSKEERMSLLLRSLLTGLLFFLIISIQLFPTFEQTYLSSRVFFTGALRGFHFKWELRQWFRILFRPELLNHDFAWELCAYVGIGGMVLSLLGLVGSRKCLPLVLIWGLIPWLISMGPAFPPFALVMKTVPGMSLLTSSSRYFIFTILILCVASGHGLEKLIKSYGNGHGKIRLFLISAGLCLFILGLLVPLYDRASYIVNIRFWGAMVIFFLLVALYLRRGALIFRILLICWLIGDPILLSVDILKGEYRIKDLQVPAKIVQALKNHPRHVRIAAIQPENLRHNLLTPFDDWLSVEHTICRAGGYEPLAMLRSLQFLTKMDGTGAINDAMWGFRLWSFARPALYNIAGVTHLITFRPIESRQLRFVARDSITMPHFHGGWWKDQPVYLYENMGAMPRAFFLPHGSSGPVSPIAIPKATPNHLRLSFQTKQPGTAVISESFHPGWIATDRDTSIHLRPFLNTFISFNVHAGKHDIALDFSPKSFRFGLLLTQIGLLFSLFIFLYEKVRVRRGKDEVTKA